MKNVTRLLTVVAAALMLFSLPAIAGESTTWQKSEGFSGASKDECLIVAMNCNTQSIDARVERIERELAKGSTVYTDSELKVLERKLQDAYRIQQINNNHFPPVSL